MLQHHGNLLQQDLDQHNLKSERGHYAACCLWCSFQNVEAAVPGTAVSGDAAGADAEAGEADGEAAVDVRVWLRVLPALRHGRCSRAVCHDHAGMQHSRVEMHTHAHIYSTQTDGSSYCFVASLLSTYATWMHQPSMLVLRLKPCI